ncbi:MAG: CHAT domain-containing protein, partial [Sphingomonadales bacterium]
GSGGTAVCSAETLSGDTVLSDMFDRGYSVACRDASVPIGRLYALRLRNGDPAVRLAGDRKDRVTCDAPQPERAEGLDDLTRASCRTTDTNVPYEVYSKRLGNTLFVAEGLVGYDSVLRLCLRSLIANRPVSGEVAVAITGAGDPASFARAQAGSISPQRAMAEAYRRNNSGNYAEAAEFFGTLSGSDKAAASRPEALVNEALQKSNLGAFGEADSLFARAEPLVGSDPVLQRQLRNYRAMHLLNQGQVAEAEAELARPMPDAGASAATSVGQLVIDKATADQLSSETQAARMVGRSEGLSPQDKAQILDAQALQIRGAMLRLQGKQAEAVDALNRAQNGLVVVREGRIAATLWMRAQILGELADISESNGNRTEAESQLGQAVALIEADYPGTSLLLTAKGRLAAFYARTGRADTALAAFRAITTGDVDTDVASPALRRVLGAYFELLTGPNGPPTAAAELFRASQLLIRPGVAQTQAILARELSGGSDEAARLFRQSVNLTRDIERSRIQLAGLQASGTAPDSRIQPLKASLARAEADQVATQAQLAQFPRFRALSNATIALDVLQAQLRPGEAYYKMVVLDSGAYGVFVTPQGARAFRIGATPRGLERLVDTLRDTISKPENGQLVTLPFDVDAAHRLYVALFGPVQGDVAAVRHLIFEPDGAMMRLPPNLLVMDQASVDAYQARAARPNDDGFDFRGVAWLGRDRDISTAVSARTFADLRQVAPSHARAQYIGFGQNAPANAFFLPASATRGLMSDDCSYSLGAWSRPISAAELLTARQVLSSHNEGEADVVTGRAFSDDAIMERTDLDQYRIVHFATHGLLVPPRPECPAKPALMTSFGGANSDGLLSFGEIFDLRLDADVVILSACDTAGRASAAANREAGVTTGGEFALDGLVRAFIGAGGRVVIASHWPVPDQFDATKRLISGMFAAPVGASTADALHAAQRALMDDAATSHPFYWAAFAIVGDGAAPLIRPEPARTASLK